MVTYDGTNSPLIRVRSLFDSERDHSDSIQNRILRDQRFWLWYEGAAFFNASLYERLGWARQYFFTNVIQRFCRGLPTTPTTRRTGARRTGARRARRTGARPRPPFTTTPPTRRTFRRTTTRRRPPPRRTPPLTFPMFCSAAAILFQAEASFLSSWLMLRRPKRGKEKNKMFRQNRNSESLIWDADSERPWRCVWKFLSMGEEGNKILLQSVQRDFQRSGKEKGVIPRYRDLIFTQQTSCEKTEKRWKLWILVHIKFRMTETKSETILEFIEPLEDIKGYWISSLGNFYMVYFYSDEDYEAFGKKPDPNLFVKVGTRVIHGENHVDLVINRKKRPFKVARLIYSYFAMKERWNIPKHIRHINGNFLDDRIENLQGIEGWGKSPESNFWSFRPSILSKFLTVFILNTVASKSQMSPIFALRNFW